MSTKYEINYAPVGAPSKRRAWRVDQVEKETGNWHTVASALTEAEAKELVAKL